MSENLIPALLWFGVIGSGVMAGIYFAFSVFIMSALAVIPQAAGVSAMQSINRVILRSGFMPLFFGTTLVSAVLVVLAIVTWEAPGSVAMCAGGLIYIVGMFVCTAARNVPLNNLLERVDPESPESGELWQRYLRDWTRWNHVRTIACMVSCGLLIKALLAR